MSDKIILGVLGTLYKMPEKEITEILKKSDGSEGLDDEKALQLIIDKDKERVNSLKTDSEKNKNEGFKTAERVTWSKVEKILKDKFDIESDLKGEELLDHISETVSAPKLKELSDDDIKNHSVYLSAQKDFKKQLTEKEREKEAALKEAEDKFTQKEIFSEVRSAALAKFKKVGEVILPSDPEKANKTIKRLFLDELENYVYEKKDDKFLPKDKEGKYLQDDHGYQLDFDELIEKIAKSNFEFKASKDRQSPANSQDAPAQKQQKEKKYTGKAPANKNEYVEMLSDDKLSSEQKMEIKAEYSAQFSKN